MGAVHMNPSSVSFDLFILYLSFQDFICSKTFVLGLQCTIYQTSQLLLFSLLFFWGGGWGGEVECFQKRRRVWRSVPLLVFRE